MKALFQLALPALLLLAVPATAQHTKSDKAKPSSPPAQVSQKLSSGPTITINYGQPSLRGRTIGKDVEPMDGKVWRLGANDATVFTTDQDVKIDGRALPAGKYALFSIKNGDTWTLVFNKIWKTWGAYDYEKNAASDVARVDVKAATGAASEKLTFRISPDGIVSFNWGTYLVSFKVDPS